MNNLILHKNNILKKSPMKKHKSMMLRTY